MLFNQLAYIGPETTVPLFSVLAAICGAVLMMGKSAVRYAAARVMALFGCRRQSTAAGPDQSLGE